MTKGAEMVDSETLNWLRGELDKKANREWVQAILEAIKSTAEESKKIGLSARNRAEAEHECVQSELIGKIMAEVIGWTKWFRIILLSSLVGVASLGGTALWKFWKLEATINTAQESVTRVEGSVTQIQKNQDVVATSVKRGLDSEDQKSKAQMDQMRLMIESAVRQALEPKGGGKDEIGSN